MCILFFLINPNPPVDGYKLILTNNRDEFYKRPTKIAHFWATTPVDVVGGVDMEPGREGGTWLAMSVTGKIGVLLNILQPVGVNNLGKEGRGNLVPDFLKGNYDGPTYLETLRTDCAKYNTYNMVTIELNDSTQSGVTVAHHTNMTTDAPLTLQPQGIHGFGNSVPDKQWKKVIKGQSLFSNIVGKYPSTSNMTELIDELILMLNDETSLAHDPQLEAQGQGRSEEFLKKLNALSVKDLELGYGTRTNTIILVNAQDEVKYIERTMEDNCDLSNPTWLVTMHNFKLKPRVNMDGDLNQNMAAA